jgi:hypothetical protein
LESPAALHQSSPDRGSGTKDQVRPRSRFAAVLAIVVAVSGIGCVVGLPSWLILVVAAVPFAVLAWSRFGTVLAFSIVVVGELFALLVILMITALLQAPMLATLEVIFTLAGLTGCVALWRGPTRLKLVSRSAFLAGIPSLAGAGVWLCAVVASRFLPGGSQLAWIMRGDSANNILLVRDLLRHHGVIIGAGSNPVPLPTVVLGVLDASGRGSVHQLGLLRHDLDALAFTWVLLIALGCVVAGVTAASIARVAGAGLFVSALTSGAASLIPLSWFFSGYPVDFGFLDAELAIPLVLVAVLACLGASRHPAIALALLMGSATLLLAVWSPLVLIPGLLALVVLRGSWREIFAVRSSRRWLGIIAVAQLGLYGVVVTLPNLIALGHLLSHGGSVYDFHRWMILALAIVALGLSLAVRRRSSAPIERAVAALVVGSGSGLAILLFISGSAWTYYPVKLAWLCSAAFLVVIVGLAAGMIARVSKAWVVQAALSAIAVIVVAAFLAWAPTAVPGYVAASTISQVTKSRALGPGDLVADRIIRLADPRRPAILWQSDDPFEQTINFWLLELWANTLHGKTALRTAAYGSYNGNDPRQLCRILGLMGNGATVYSSQAGLQAKIDVLCPERRAIVSREAAQ